MRFRTRKGSVVVVDALNGDSAARWVMGLSNQAQGPEESLSIRQEKDITRVIFCRPKAYGVTGHARVGGLQLAQLVEHRPLKPTVKGSIPLLSNKTQSRVRHCTIVA